MTIMSSTQMKHQLKYERMVALPDPGVILWVYRTGSLEAHPFVLYEYQKGRKADYPRQFLKDCSGICVTDGYEVYHSIARERNDLTIAGCWSHARRDFADV